MKLWCHRHDQVIDVLAKSPLVVKIAKFRFQYIFTASAISIVVFLQRAVIIEFKKFSKLDQIGAIFICTLIQ